MRWPRRPAPPQCTCGHSPGHHGQVGARGERAATRQRSLGPARGAGALARESIVASAWGTQTDWYRNLRARPALAVRTGGAWYVPDVRTVPPDEAFAIFDDWTRRQRWFAALMLGQIGLSWHVPEAEQRAIVAGFPFVAFRPAGAGEPRPARGLTPSTPLELAAVPRTVAPGLDA